MKFFVAGQDNENRKPLSLKQIIPSVFTSGHLLCGMFSLTLAFDGRFVPASWMVLLALIFDSVDGRLARALDVNSQFGMHFDSLSDVIGFGVAPAIIMYGSALNRLGVTGAIVAAFFALCVVLRVARFNVTPSSGSRPYQGLPCPAAGLLMLSFLKAGVPVEAAPAVMAFFMVALGVLMLSSIPYSNAKKLKKENANKKKCFALLCVILLSIVLLQGAVFLLFWSVYIISGILRFDWDKWLAIIPPEPEV